MKTKKGGTSKLLATRSKKSTKESIAIACHFNVLNFFWWSHSSGILKSNSSKKAPFCLFSFSPLYASIFFFTLTPLTHHLSVCLFVFYICLFSFLLPRHASVKIFELPQTKEHSITISPRFFSRHSKRYIAFCRFDKKKTFI